MKKRDRVKRSEVLFPAWQRNMNPEQMAAINHDKGPARLLAAAGSGKTRCVTHRMARLVDSGVDPARILALTFSKKAADEMAKRVEDLDVRGARVGTWHSVCLEIIRKDRTKWSDWELRENTRTELKTVLGYKEMNWKGADPNLVDSFIGRCKANLFTPDSDGAKQLATSMFGGYNAKLGLEAFFRYNETLERKEIITFDDFLVFVADHLADEDNRLNWAQKWDYLIQDEAQDENHAQRHICNLLARDHRNYMAVGDVYQAIYSFRGSSPLYLAKFEEEWPDAVTYWLPRNYRSGSDIITAANGIVLKATVEGHEPKEMIAERKQNGQPFAGNVSARVAEDLDDEAEGFVSWIMNMTRTGDAKHSDVTALFRTNAQSRALEEALLGARIPYVVVGGTSFYERKEVRDILGYLRIAEGRGDADDVKRCINAPFRFLGAAFVSRLMSAAEQEMETTPKLQASFPDVEVTLDWASLVCDIADGDRIQRRQKETALEWAAMVSTIHERIVKDTTNDQQAKEEARPSVILDDIIRQTRYLEWIAKEEGDETIETSRASNVRELVRVAERFSTCRELLDYIDETIRSARKQREDKQAGGDRVLLMNVHRSKGLEWPHVWIAGFNEQIFPHMRGDPEEERRLAYVATTRARDSLVMSYVRTMATRAGIRDAAPSRFLADTGVSPDSPVGAEIAQAQAQEAPLDTIDDSFV